MKKYLPLLLFSLFCAYTCAEAFNFGLNFGFGAKNSAKYEALAPSLAWSPMSSVFGNTTTGKSHVAQFTITNSGNDLAEDVAVSTSSPFSLYSTVTQGNISSSRSRIVKVRFSPTSAGEATAYVNYSAPNIARTGAKLRGTGVSASVTLLYKETFEATGYDTTTWTYSGGGAGTPDPDYSTTGIDMVGSQCLDETLNRVVSWTLGTAVDSSTGAYVVYKIRPTSTAQADYKNYLRNASNASLCRVQMQASPAGSYKTFCEGGGWSAATSETIAANNSQYLRVRWKKGSGTDAECGISVWTGSAWGAEAACTNGTGTTDLKRIDFQNQYADTIVDQIGVNNATFNPPY